MMNRRHPWSTFAVFQTTVTSWSLAYDVVLSWLWWRATSDLQADWRLIARVSVYLWIFLGCRLIKYTEHFLRFPVDLIYIPLIPLFGYFHSICVKLHAMLTLQVVSDDKVPSHGARTRWSGLANRRRMACLLIQLVGSAAIFQSWHIAGTVLVVQYFTAARKGFPRVVG